MGKVHQLHQSHLKQAKRVPANAIARVGEMGKGRAYRSVWAFKKLKTNGNLTREEMLENKTGQIVSKARHMLGKDRYEKVGMDLWIKALEQARSEQRVTGFVPAKKKGGTKKQKALYDRAEQLHKELKAHRVLSELLRMDKATSKQFKNIVAQKEVAAKLQKVLPSKSPDPKK